MGFFGSNKSNSSSTSKLQRRVEGLESALEKQKMNLSLAKSNNVGLQQNLTEYKNKVRNLEKEILRLVQGLIPAEYIKKRKEDANIDNWDADKLVDFTIDTVKAKHNSLVKEKTDLKKKNRNLKEEKMQLEQKLDGYLNNQKNNLNKKEEFEDKVVSDLEKESQENEQSQEEPAQQPPPPKKENKKGNFNSVKKAVEENLSNKNNEDNEKENKKNSNKDLRKIAEDMDSGHWVLLEGIGKEGIYRTKELKRYDRVNDLLETNYAYNSHLNFLIENELIDVKEEDFFIGVRGHSYNVFVLTSSGKELFESKFGKKPKKSMRDWLISQHSNLKHGILIHDTAITFENYGYDVFMDRETNTVQVSDDKDGERVVFDLTVKQGPIVKHIEVERGNHKQSDFEKKLDKISDVTSSFYFVVHNNKAKDNIKTKYSKWIAKIRDKQKRQKFVFNIITLEELKKNEDNWEKIKLSR